MLEALVHFSYVADHLKTVFHGSIVSTGMCGGRGIAIVARVSSFVLGCAGATVRVGPERWVETLLMRVRHTFHIRIVVRTWSCNMYALNCKPLFRDYVM